MATLQIQRRSKLQVSRGQRKRFKFQGEKLKLKFKMA
jgi:hypothetical protein